MTGAGEERWKNGRLTGGRNVPPATFNTQKQPWVNNGIMPTHEPEHVHKRTHTNTHTLEQKPGRTQTCTHTESSL